MRIEDKLWDFMRWNGFHAFNNEMILKAIPVFISKKNLKVEELRDLFQFASECASQYSEHLKDIDEKNRFIIETFCK